jgi:hypothetical protein
MPLIYLEALKRRNRIVQDTFLEQLEIHGFAKCVARKTCVYGTREELIKVLTDSLAKQYVDFAEAVDNEDKLEALADIRNVAGLLFLALKEA